MPEYNEIVRASKVLLGEDDRIPPKESDDSVPAPSSAWLAYVHNRSGDQEATAAPPLKEWIDTVERDAFVYSSPEGMRLHHLFAELRKADRNALLKAALNALDSSPITAITLASEALGDNGPEISNEDKLDFTLVISKWKQWGKARNYLRVTSTPSVESSEELPLRATFHD